jgi:hypothetical protein
MAQIFRPSSNTAAKVLLGLGAVAPLGIIIGLSELTRSGWVTRVGTPLEQPVPFSHEHHVNELGIDCRYCHTSVEKSAKAGYPATHTCMSCHSQVWSNSPLLEPVRESYTKNIPLKWNVLNKVPDFVYFNHSIHIKRGISCNNCHGAVQAMQMAYKGRPFQMQWCLECHRNPANYVNKPEFVWDLYRKIQTDPTQLSNEENSLMLGKQYQRTKKELETGQKLLDQYKVKKDQLSDCAVCHH